MPTKEEIFDTLIAPLEDQITAICKEHKIARVSGMSLDRDTGLNVSTVLCIREHSPPVEYLAIAAILAEGIDVVPRLTELIQMASLMDKAESSESLQKLKEETGTGLEEDAVINDESVSEEAKS